MKNLGTISDNKDLVTKEYVESRNLLRRDNVVVATDGTPSILIPISVTDVSALLVFQNGILLISPTHYTATTTEITLVDYTANSGDVFTFINIAF